MFDKNRKLAVLISAVETNKQLIESSLGNVKLAKLERFNLIKQAAEMNNPIAELKGLIDKVTILNVSKDNRRRIINLCYGGELANNGR